MERFPPLLPGVWYSSLRPTSRSMRVASRIHCGSPQGLMCGSPRGPREQTLRLKFSILGGFLALPTKTSFTKPHYYPKYEVWAIEIFFCGRIPLSFRRRYIQDLIVTDPIYIRFLYPMSSISLSASIFMTVSVTVERYWAVCKPAVGYYSKR